MAKKIIPYSDLATNCIRKVTNKTTHICGYSLNEAPSSDVTVTVTISNGKLTRSPTSLTFTTLNWFTPQIVTYTGVNDGVTDIITNETITLAASGGGFDSVTLVQDGFVYDTITGTYYYGWFGQPSWMDFYSLTNGVAATRSSAIGYIFNGNGLPSGYSTLTVMSTTHTGTMHLIQSSSLTGFSSISRYRVTWLDVDGFTWTHYLYHIFSSTAVGKLLIDHIGHETDTSQNHSALISAALAAGVDVLYSSMPVIGENVETNPTVTSTSVTGHNQMLSGGLDRVGYSPLELFFFDKVIGLNYIEANFSYGSNVFACGISGGGWTVTLLGAIDTRVKKVFGCRGVMPQKMKSVNGDYEQGDSLATSGTRLYNSFYRTIASMSDFILLCCTDSRYYKTVTNSYDGTVGAPVWKYVGAKFTALATQYGGTYEQSISNASGQASHAYQTDDIAAIVSEL